MKDWQLQWGGELNGESSLRCYGASDCTAYADDYKSTSGRVITGRVAVDWSLKMQKPTAQSTTDAE